jgi:secretion system chaperone SscA
METEQTILKDFFEQGGSLRMLADIEQEDLDRVYAYTYDLYRQERYAAAKINFYTLARIDQWNFDYWLALGLSCQRLEEHQQAIFCFVRSGTIRWKDPRSSYFAGVSYQLLGNTEYATKAFSASIKWCAKRSEYQGLRAAASQSLATCNTGES